VSDWPQKFLRAYSELHHYESVTESDAGLTLDDAYDIQHRYVKLRNESITGYKAALTAPQAQQAMGVNMPIVGVLLASGAFTAEQPVILNKRALLETEIGYRTAKAITEPVTADTVFGCLACCLPMIEIASPNLATKPNGLDLIATNSASYGYICGAEHEIDPAVLNQAEVSLRQDDTVLLSGTGGEVLDGQEQALTWLINETLARGYSIDAGQLLMSGSIGGMCPAEPGTYHASFGELSSMEFTISQTQ
jgi:2-keto-4-pentenoate hydratase